MWQQNANKSPAAHQALLETAGKNFDFILIQEPYIDHLATTRANSYYTIIYPPRHRDDHPKKAYTRSVILVNKRINTNNWEALPIDCPDMTAIKLKMERGIIRIFNIYNDCDHNDTLETLKAYINDPSNRPSDGEPVHDVWAGDFNRHNPLWDEPRNYQLFTNRNLDMAELLLELVTSHYMKMALPGQIPTLRAMGNGNFTRVDNVFISDTLYDTLIKCNAHPQDLPPNTDHFSIETEMDIEAPPVQEVRWRNFRAVDWEDFNNTLQDKMRRISPPTKIYSTAEFRRRVKEFNEAVTQTIEEKVPFSRPCPHSKRWWNKELRQMRQETRKIGRTTAKYMHAPEHPAHEEFRVKRNAYAKLLIETKQKHWANWLKNISAADMWTASQLVTGTIPQGGRTRVPTLVVKDPETSEEQQVTDNNKKSKAFYNVFFPPKPATSTVPANPQYPPLAWKFVNIDKRQIHRVIDKMKPHKGTKQGTWPNVVFQKTADLTVPYLTPIYRAVFDLETYHERWAATGTLAFRKPGKPDYSVLEAWRPIVLSEPEG
jgi:hypothetical protein